MTSDELDPLLSPRESAALLGVAVRTLRQWEARGWITARRLPNGHRRFLRSELVALMQSASRRPA